jgi:hypothetical protein
MKHLKKFNENKDIKSEILEYLKKEYPEQWWTDQFNERVYDYIIDDDLIGYGTEEDPDYESEEDAYKNLAMGGAIEYDLIDEICNDLIKKYNMNSDDFYKNDYSDIVNDYMIDTIDWYDSFVFNKSDEGYISIQDKMFGKINPLDINWD